MEVPAIVTAGDRRAAKSVYGKSKVFLEIAGLPLVVHVVLALQRVPEISEVLVVGDSERLQPLFDAHSVKSRLTKPLRVVEQFRNLYENCWEGFRRTLPGAPPDGRDPVSEADLDHQVLYLSGDLPFATPHEIAALVRRSQSAGCDYALGLVTHQALVPFEP
ncbi:MAG: NTP transferase domain-containing protein, partial [Proteobacteria bacterium]|nr:NTP transferase domain-containing protein [Pseudomonadota bacterium]